MVQRTSLAQLNVNLLDLLAELSHLASDFRPNRGTFTGHLGNNPLRLLDGRSQSFFLLAISGHIRHLGGLLRLIGG